MNNKEFQKKLDSNRMRAYHLAQDLGITPATITNWNKKNKFPNYIEYYFENLELKEKIAELNNLLYNLSIKKNKKL
jgi:uncharacterized protein YjcR